MKRLVSILVATVILVGLGVLLIPKNDSSKDETKKLSHQALLAPPQITEGGSENQLDNPELAFLQNYEMTKDPSLGYPPLQRKIAAFDQIKEAQRNLRASESAIPGVQWVERGPDNVGGRTRAILFDPADSESKRVWAGATGGGLWVNSDITDNASEWTNVAGFIDNLAISSITYDPTNISTMYIGTGLQFSRVAIGDGIWKSIDAGVTWNQLSSTADGTFSSVQDILVTQTGVLFAASVNGLMRSTNGGDSWTTVRTGDFADIEEAANGDLYFSTGIFSNGLLFKSTDDGLTLADITPQNNADRIEIATAPSNANVVYAVAEGGSGEQDVEWFVRSDDAGATWTDVTIPLIINTDGGGCAVGPEHFTRGQAFFDLILAVHPLDENILIAGGIDLHKTTNGGQDWNPISYWTGNNCEDFVHADQHAIVFRPNFPNEALFGNDGGLSYSSNVGDSDDPDFETRINKYNVTMFYSIAMTNEPGSNIMLAGAQDNNTVRFTEAGMNSTRPVFGGDGALAFIDQTDPNIQMTAFVFNFIARSDNGGRSFTTLNNDQVNGRFINPADYDDTQGFYFSAGNSNQIKRIRGIKDNPMQQETIAVGLDGAQISAIKVSPNVPRRVFVGTGGNGRIYRIDSTHRTQMVVTPLDGDFNGTPGTFVSGIEIGDTDDQIAITYSNFGRTSVYETTNGGTSWRSREGNLPDIPVRDILYNPDNRNEVLLATELGVWSTTQFNSASPVWEPTNSGLASVRVDKLEYRQADKLVAAATHGRGVFTSTVFANTSIADFKANSVVGYTDIPVQFSDASTRVGSDFSWDFGNGNISTDQNPTNTYTEPGTYTVSLTIDGGADTETKTNYLTILPKQLPPYTLQDGGDFETDNGHFVGLSILHDVNLWERGTPTGNISQTSSGTNAWKTGISSLVSNQGFDYQSALYTPAFDLTDPNRDYTLKFKRSGNTVSGIGPIGMYMEYSLDGGTSWQILGSSFNETGQINWYERGPNRSSFLVQPISDTQMGWADESTVNNVDTQIKLNQFIGQSNISFRFITGVTSIFNGGYDVDGFMIDDFEVTATDPTADFQASRTIVPENGNIQFSYTSNGAESFAWDFGDGNTSTEQDPIHSYASAGIYTVALTITSNGNSVTETKTDFITILPSVSTPYLLADGGDFETNQSHFSAVNTAGTPWELGTSNVAGKDGTSSGNFAWVTGIEKSLYSANSIALLISPSFIFDQPQEYILEFKAKFNFEDNFDGFIVEYSTDLGETFIKLNNTIEAGWYNQASSNTGSVFGTSEPMFSGNTAGDFQTFSTDVSFLYPNESVQFRFNFMTDTNVEAPGGAIDDFQLLAQTPAAPVADFTTSATIGCSGQTIVFTDASTGSINGYQWDFGANASPATAMGVGPHTVTYSGTGLSSPSLTLVNNFGGEDTETKIDLITTSATHTPTITRGETSDPEIISLTATTGDSYQWFRNNQALTAETGQILTTGEDGLYTVEVTINGCAVRAAALNVVIIVTGLEDDIVFSKTVNLFPNPVQDELNISISNDVLGQHSISFYTYDGRLMRQEKRLKDERDETFVFDIAEMSQGNYLIQITSPKGATVKKIIKQ